MNSALKLKKMEIEQKINFITNNTGNEVFGIVKQHSDRQQLQELIQKENELFIAKVSNKTNTLNMKLMENKYANQENMMNKLAEENRRKKELMLNEKKEFQRMQQELKILKQQQEQNMRKEEMEKDKLEKNQKNRVNRMRRD